MNATKDMLTELDSLRKEHLDADIIALLTERLDIPAEHAMHLYYRSRLARQIDAGTYDIQALDSHYLVDDLLDNESDLFRGVDGK